MNTAHTSEEEAFEVLFNDIEEWRHLCNCGPISRARALALLQLIGPRGPDESIERFMDRFFAAVRSEYPHLLNLPVEKPAPVEIDQPFLWRKVLEVCLVCLAVAAIVTGAAFAIHSITTRPRAAAAVQPDPDAAAYASQVKIQDVIYQTVNGMPAVYGKVKNTGDRTLKEVRLTAYFQDDQGKPIFERSFPAVSSAAWNDKELGAPLKPNYEREFAQHFHRYPPGLAGQFQNFRFEVEAYAPMDDAKLRRALLSWMRHHHKGEELRGKKIKIESNHGRRLR